MEKEMKKEGKCEVCCGCFCHAGTWSGIGIVVFGLLFLLQNLGWLDTGIVGIVWPILVILAGLKFFCRCCRGNCVC